MKEKVFFSYSWKDIPIAMRIYSDLVRNGLFVWRDEFSASAGKSYKSEINRALKLCEGALLLDSSNSRRSRYVKDEWDVIMSDKDWANGEKKIVVCLISDQAVTHAEPELFKDQNGVKFIDFSKCSQLFDNDRSYLNAISELCRCFGFSFHSSYPDTSEKDFEDELSKYNIKDIDRKILLREFELIQFRLTNFFPNTIQRLESFNKECESLEIICPSPLLQLGVELAKAADYEKAKHVLNIYTQIYSDDSRGWKAFGSVLFELNEFETALTAYNNTISLTLEIKKVNLTEATTSIRFNNEKSLEYLLVSRINRATTLFKLGRYAEAIYEYETIFNENDINGQLLPEYYLTVIDVYDETGQKSMQNKWIDAGLSKYPGDYQLNLAKARWLFENNDLKLSATYYEYLVNREAQDIKVISEYLSLLKCIGSFDRFSCVIKEAVKIAPVSDCDMYYYGYVLFLNHNISEAKEYFEKSHCSELPWYSHLWKD